MGQERKGYIVHLFSFCHLYNKLKFGFKRYVGGGREDYLDTTHSSSPHFILSSSNNPELISYTQILQKKELGKITFPSIKMDYTKKKHPNRFQQLLSYLCVGKRELSDAISLYNVSGSRGYQTPFPIQQKQYNYIYYEKKI